MDGSCTIYVKRCNDKFLSNTRSYSSDRCYTTVHQTKEKNLLEEGTPEPSMLREMGLQIHTTQLICNLRSLGNHIQWPQNK